MTRKTTSPAPAGNRRKFIKASTGVAAAGATLGFPMIAKGPGHADRDAVAVDPGRPRTSSTSTPTTSPRRSTT